MCCCCCRRCRRCSWRQQAGQRNVHTPFFSLSRTHTHTHAHTLPASVLLSPPPPTSPHHHQPPCPTCSPTYRSSTAAAAAHDAQCASLEISLTHACIMCCCCCSWLVSCVRLPACSFGRVLLWNAAPPTHMCCVVVAAAMQCALHCTACDRLHCNAFAGRFLAHM